jgi:hypothetical protein
MSEFMPFGPEWEKEMMKMTKKEIIKMFSNASFVDDLTTKLVEKLEGVANMLRGMTFDPRISEDIKDAMRYKIAEIDIFCDGIE